MKSAFWRSIAVLALVAAPMMANANDATIGSEAAHWSMMGGTLMAFLGGLHFWWPKMFGRMYSERWGKISTALVFVGFNVTFFTQFILGAKGMPRRYYSYLDQYQPLHAFSSVGSWILGLGFLIMFIYLTHSLVKGRKASGNPWGSLTLEWSNSSPPPLENFESNPKLEYGPYDYDKKIIERNGQ